MGTRLCPICNNATQQTTAPAPSSMIGGLIYAVTCRTCVYLIPIFVRWGTSDADKKRTLDLEFTHAISRVRELLEG